MPPGSAEKLPAEAAHLEGTGLRFLRPQTPLGPLDEASQYTTPGDTRIPMERTTPDRPWPLFDTAATRRIEKASLAGLPPHTLMRRAGAALAQLAGALAPHARMVWIACGPGNNGGDGLEAATLLHRAGRPVTVTLAGDPGRLPADAAAALARAREAGVAFADGCPPGLAAQDLCIDALLGLGASAATGREPPPWLAKALRALREVPCPVLAVDLPSGLRADTGQWSTGTEPGHPAADAPSPHRQHRHTLALLTLKPGLFTAEGRDAAGTVWRDTLDIDPAGTDGGVPPTAWLAGPPPTAQRPHATHKGRYGDVAVVGGEGLGRRGMGMTGAAVLAATAALHAGAGRVLLALLDGNAGVTIDVAQPELMLRTLAALDLHLGAVVCGCGGGEAVREALPRVLGESSRLVLDADALNAIAADETLQHLLEHRAARGAPTVLTPHPLEAGRLLDRKAAEVQADRLDTARTLARRFGCVAVLKGSGTVVAAPDGRVSLNPTGNGRLATAGTGDVLAGMVGARLAGGMDAFEAATAAVYEHGALADRWPASQPLTAGLLARNSGRAA